MADPFFQVMLSGLLLGSLYGLAGTGLNLIMGATGQVHLAYGHLWAAAGLAAAGLINAGVLAPLPAIGLVTLAWALGAMALHPAALWRGGSGPGAPQRFFLITLGVALIIEDLGAGLAPLPVTALAMAPRALAIAGLIVSPVRAATLALLAVLALGLALGLRFNRWGRALRAWDQGRGPLWTVGVDPAGLGRRLIVVTIGLAGLAGGLLCLGHTIAIQEGMAMTMRCICVAAAGGTGAWPVMAAGLGLGLSEALIGHVLGTRWMALVPCVLVMVTAHARRSKTPWPAPP